MPERPSRTLAPAALINAAVEGSSLSLPGEAQPASLSLTVPRTLREGCRRNPTIAWG